MLILGIDDAGRGPLIGPMILAGVLVTKEQEKALKKIGVADSKLLSHKTRVELEKKIKEKATKTKAVIVPAYDIDSALLSGTNLNTLEAKKTAEIINDITKGKKVLIKVIVDCPSNNISKWRNTLMKYIKNPSYLEVICEHKADYNHPSVSAASILAKVTREEEMDKLRKKYPDIGSGYPSDPLTQEFLKKNGKKLANEGIFRKTWQTWKSLFPEKSQKTFGDF